ncbi:MAG: cyclic nucleotide-binding domain-containing protein [bacterium]
MDSPEHLKKIPLFQLCSYAELTRIWNYMQKVNFNAGDTVFRQGDNGDALYVIREGEMEILAASPDKDRIENVVASLGPGELFGEMALVENEPRSASVRARTDAKLFRLQKDYFEKLMKQDHELAYKIYQPLTAILSQRLRETTERLALANKIIQMVSSKEKAKQE